jgi:hypothetical protein
MKRRDFATGQLVWLGAAIDHDSTAMIPCKSGYPKTVKITRGEPATILRKALAKDFGVYGRHTYKGVSTAATLAGESWLVLYNGIPVILKDAYLCKRRYTPKRKPQEV